MRKIWVYIASLLHPNLVVCSCGLRMVSAYCWILTIHGWMFIHLSCALHPRSLHIYLGTYPCYNPVCIYKGLHWTTQGQIMELSPMARRGCQGAFAWDLATGRHIVRYYDVALGGLLGLSGNDPDGACRAEQGHVCESRLFADSTTVVFLGKVVHCHAYTFQIPDFLAHFSTVCPFSRRIMKLAWNGYKIRRPAASGTGAHDVEDYLHAFDRHPDSRSSA